ncbi:MAG: toll/interleukin-1 receptor domain-containing protein [Chloroflexota bacterium]|nr:toll/interleukin-1 receptor domain-containing protein [Chloroflexota bacterium]
MVGKTEISPPHWSARDTYNGLMVEALDKYALDVLDREPGAKALIKEMLAAYVEHPDIHVNSFQVKNERGAGFSYFLGLHGGGRPSPFINNRRLANNIVPLLLFHGIAERSRVPNQPDGWYGFTDDVLSWHNQHGGPEPDEVRKRIGRWLQKQVGGPNREFRVDEVAQEVGISPERVRHETNMLLSGRLVEQILSGDMEFGVLRLAEPHGIYWAAGEFQPIGNLSTVREIPLSAMPSLVQPPMALTETEGRKTRRRYDVFICHASEDKDDLVRPLAHALVAEDLSVWYDEFELKIGNSLRRKIDTGLASSRFGIIVLSEHFFNKDWPNHELDGIVARSVPGKQDILPIWHRISKDQVLAYSPPLADKVARSTSNRTVQEIATEISAVVKQTTS